MARRAVGIMRETYSAWERRVPLCPQAVEKLVTAGVDVFVQPSTRRIFRDVEYAAAGATVTHDLSPADIIVGVKQVAIDELLASKTYMFFSHVIKGQPENMNLLRTVQDRNIELIDYECLTENGIRGGRRLIAFGGYAGRAGMIDSLRGLGQQLLFRGYNTPFVSIGSAYMYPSLEHAKNAVSAAGKSFAEMCIVGDSFPLTFAFTGRGAVSTGAQEIFRLLPHEFVEPEDLAEVKQHGDPSVLYATVVQPGDYSERIEPGTFDMEEYCANPMMYTPQFHEKFLPHISVLMNCMYWDVSCPRLVTNDQLTTEWQDHSNERLLMVGDITCDIGGSIEFLTRSTKIEDPFFMWDPVQQEIAASDAAGVLVLGVDILPSELPRESSTHFSKLLSPMIEALATGTADADMTDVLNGACITRDGSLQPRYDYIPKLADHLVREAKESGNEGETLGQLKIRGHLFDTGLINKALDLLEALGVSFVIDRIDVQPNLGFGRQVPSSVLISLPIDRVDDVCAAIGVQLEAFPNAHATVTIV
eukprot:m.174852 g.174852  ORF g.174852 m.174852 type:complete len:532 (-) comp13881_c0_seq1:99-1694(-)